MGGQSSKCCCQGGAVAVVDNDASLEPSKYSDDFPNEEPIHFRDDGNAGVSENSTSGVQVADKDEKPLEPKVEVIQEVKPSALQVEDVAASRGEDNKNAANEQNGSSLEKPLPPKPFQDRQFEDFCAKGGTPADKFSSMPRRPSSVDTTLQNYVAKYGSGWSEFLAMETMDGWNFNKEEDGVKIYLKQTKGIPFLSFKAVTEIECSHDRLPAIVSDLLNVAKRPQWDKMCLEARAVETFRPFYGVTYVRIQSPAIVSNRDLCLLGRIQFTEDNGVIMMVTSTTHPDAPVAPSHVRCEMIRGGYSIRPVPGKEAIRMMYFGTVDPKGWLPLWVANMVAWKQGMALVLFKKNLKTAGII